MKYIETGSTDPCYNLAFEEYVFNNFKDDDYVLLWQNNRAIIVGKNQNTLEEINPKAVEEEKVKVVRRVTGGGAVYHDMGNLNFSYISDWALMKGSGYDKFLNPIIKGLSFLGVEAYIEGRNDLLTDGKKISGNAQAMKDDRILHHGTLLFDSDLQTIQKLLNVDKEKISSKGLKSIKSRVGNIKDYANVSVTVENLKENLLKAFFEDGKTTQIYLNEAELLEVEKLANEKYSTWEWNFGSSPNYSFINSKRFSAGKVRIEIDAEKSIIRDCKITGDFLALKDISDIENSLKNIKFEKQDIKKALEQVDLKMYFGDLQLEELLECFE